MRRFPVVALCFALVLALVACGDDDDAPAEGDGAEDSAELDLRANGVLTVGSNIAYAPFESFEAGDDAVGFDIDVMTEIADRLGLDVRFVDNPSFDALIPSLQDGQYDAVISAMTILPEREEEVDFSDPYFEADQALAVNVEETPDLTSADALTTEMVVGVERGTTGQIYAEENLEADVREIRIFNDTPSSLSDLAAGRIQAAVHDFPVVAFAAENEFEGVIEVAERFATDESYGIAVATGNDALLDAINSALAEMRDDGTYDEIFEKWFGEVP